MDKEEMTTLSEDNPFFLREWDYHKKWNPGGDVSLEEEWR